MEKNCDEQEAELGDHVRQMPNLPDLDTDRRFEQCRMDIACEKGKSSVIIVGFVISKTTGSCFPFGNQAYKKALEGMAPSVQRRIIQAER